MIFVFLIYSPVPPSAFPKSRIARAASAWAPAITIAQAGLSVGSSTYNTSLARQFQFTDAVTWQHGRHRIRFGVDWEHHRGGNTVWMYVPASITLFSPQQARQNNLPVPASF